MQHIRCFLSLYAHTCMTCSLHLDLRIIIGE